jgi:hypothetical protein
LRQPRGPLEASSTGGSKSASSGWDGYAVQTAVNDGSELLIFGQQKRPDDHDVGLRTGLVFDVVDLDSEDAVDALEEARGGRAPLRGPLVATGKGFHYYVQLAGIGNRAGILPGVDYRGRGGYVVGPPSEHPDGHRYRWVNPLRDELARVPLWLIQLLVQERGPERLRAVPEGSRAYGLGALRRELQRLSQTREGSRNHQLNVASFNMGRLVAAGDIDETEAASALIEQGQRIGLGATECERTVASGLGAGWERGCSSPEVLGVLVERMRSRP